MQAQEFKCRASAGGIIMTNDRSGKNMGDTAKNFGAMWIKEGIYNRRKEFKSKYTDKGILNEDAAIKEAGHYYGFSAVKNTDWKQDEYFTGECDIVLENTVIDIKNSWDFDTFPLFAKTIPEKGYEYQVQIYMHLWGKKKASVIYCLLDAPDEIIEAEAQRKAWQINGGELNQEIYDSVQQQMSYCEVPKEYRFKKFDFTYDPEIIAQLQLRVVQLRTHIADLLTIFDNSKNLG